MKSRMFIVLIAVLSSFFISAPGLRADSEPMGVIEFTTQSPEGAISRFEPLSENEAYYRIVKDGLVVGESATQLQEMDVIIQLKGDPLIRLKGLKGASMASAVADREWVRNLVKAEIIRLDNNARLVEGLSARSSGEIIKREYHLVFNGLAARVTRGAIKEIERLAQVKKVWRDGKVQALLNEGVPLIRADKVWTDLGVTGRGIVVAIVDTGVDYTHPDLGGCLGPSCKVIGGYDIINDDVDPMDDYGHGTHCAGIVAANGAIKGVAPDAKLMAFKVLDSEGSGWDSDVVAGIELAVDPDGNPATNDGADIISLSLGGPGTPDDPVSQAVDNAVAAGVVVVVAAGNSGPGYGTLLSPGVARQALTVGASDKSDQIAFFSSRGSAPVTFQIKPEVVAPGVAITSTVPRGTCLLCDPSGYKALRGTSMAAPHVAGAAALLLERFPHWTPQQVREALMEPSVNLGLDAFTQGSGRIDVFSSATSSVLGSPGNLSLGLDDISQPTFSAHKTINLTNQTTSPKSYQLSVQGSFPSGMTVTVTPVALTLGPGETKSFAFDLYVDNTVVPNPPSAPYAYEGKIVAAGNGESLRFPFAFIKGASMQVNFSEPPDLLIIHNDSNYSNWVWDPGTTRSMIIPEGTYNLITVFDNSTWVFREGVVVRPTAKVDISKSEAVHQLTLEPIDKDGYSLIPSRSMWASMIRYKSTGFGIISGGLSSITEWKFSQVSSAYLFETSLIENRTPVGGPLYTFHGAARDGISGSMRFRNSPSDFKRVVTRYQVDPGVSQILPRIYLADRFGGSLTFCYFPDPPLRAPFEEQAYYSPAPYADFGLGYVVKQVYRNPPSPCGFRREDFLYRTPYIMAKDKTQLDLSFIDPYGPIPVFSTASDHLPSGIGPHHWIGLFKNGSTMMILWSGIRAWAATGLFTGQLGDVRDHYPVPYELYQNGVLFQSGFLNQGDPWGSPGLIGIYLPAPGAYRLQIPYTNYFIAGQQGSALMEASFDSGKSDRDPPYLTQFNVFDNGEPTDTVLSGTGQVVFRVLDDVGLKQVTLYYDAGSGWQALGLTRNGDQYVADMPTLGANTFVSLKLVAEDTSGNRLSHEMRPALFVQGVSENVSTPSTLGGPTSGNTGTSYTYSTGGSSSNLGHSLQYLFDWGDGSNSGWLPIGTTSASKSWASAGTYNVKAQARCATDPSVVSDWSSGLSVTISVPETVSKPSTPSGPTNGISGASYTYSTGGSSSNLGHSVQYLFDWGDGTDSGWLPVGTTSASKSWASAGTYNIKAQARCATHTSVVSDWSQTFSVNIVYSWQSESVNWQVYYGNNWNRSGTVTKPGPTRIRLHFSTIDLERGYDHLRTDVGNDWSGSYSNVFSNEKSGNSIGLTLTSDFSVNGSFVIDRVEWLGTATGPATRSGNLFGVPTPQPPSPPTSVSASDGTYADRVRLTWTASSGATGYKVFRNTSNNSSGAQQIGTSTASQYDDMTAVVGTTYWYWVKAYNSAGDSGFSNGDSGYVSSPTPQPLSPPTSVSASDGAYTDRVRLTWTASSGATGYKVFRNTSNNSSGAQQIGTSTASQYDDTTAVVGTTYWYWVKAYNSAGDSGFSNGDSGYVASSSSWQSESVNWTVVYGNNWSRSGTVIKPGATRIRLHFSAISLEVGADHLRTDAGDDWSRDYSNVTSREKAGNSIGLTLTSDYSRTGYFIIDRVEWQGTASGPATKSGTLFQ